MRIIQLFSSLSYGDAIGNDILALDSIIKEKGFQTKIYAEKIDKRISSELASNISEFTPEPTDLLILHIGGATKLNQWIKNVKCKKIMIYHNITPSEFFEDYNKKSAEYCKRGLKEVESLNKTFDMVLACSDFNKQNLIDMGYSCEINVLPILIPFEDYKKTPSQAVIDKYNDDFTNIIFLGRLVPNKKQEHILEAFSEYQKKFNKKSRLFLVGNPTGCENYSEKLKEYAKKLDLKNVIFTGHTRFDEILAYYKISDLFLCMSEHEGFCVPLVEAMFFDLPIVAYASSAIPWTLGGSGFLLNEKTPALTAGVMNAILTDNSLKNKILKNQQERLSDFNHDKVAEQFWSYISKFLDE